MFSKIFFKKSSSSSTGAVSAHGPHAANTFSTCQPHYYLGCTCVAAQLGYGTLSTASSRTGSSTPTPTPTPTISTARLSTEPTVGAKVDFCGRPLPLSGRQYAFDLVPLQVAQGTETIRLRSVAHFPTPEPVRLPFATADWKNFDLIALPEAQARSDIRYRTLAL